MAGTASNTKDKLGEKELKRYANLELDTTKLTGNMKTLFEHIHERNAANTPAEQAAAKQKTEKFINSQGKDSLEKELGENKIINAALAKEDQKAAKIKANAPAAKKVGQQLKKLEKVGAKVEESDSLFALLLANSLRIRKEGLTMYKKHLEGESIGTQLEKKVKKQVDKIEKQVNKVKSVVNAFQKAGQKIQKVADKVSQKIQPDDTKKTTPVPKSASNSKDAKKLTRLRMERTLLKYKRTRLVNGARGVLFSDQAEKEHDRQVGIVNKQIDAKNKQVQAQKKIIKNKLPQSGVNKEQTKNLNSSVGQFKEADPDRVKQSTSEGTANTGQTGSKIVGEKKPPLPSSSSSSDAEGAAQKQERQPPVEREDKLGNTLEKTELGDTDSAVPEPTNDQANLPENK
jgi:hypothetical protein